MLEIKIYNQEGEEAGKIELPERIFNVEFKDSLVHQVAVAHQANSRRVLAHTKNRGEVRGGGRKPWAQKHTGRSRQGSIRAPQWKHGGIVFGPNKERNYSKKVNKKMKAKALFMVLSSKLKDKEFIVIEDFKFKKPSTTEMSKIIKKLAIKGKTLISLGKKEENVIKSIKNIPGTSVIASNSLNATDLLKYKNLIITKDGIKKIEDTFKYAFK